MIKIISNILLGRKQVQIMSDKELRRAIIVHNHLFKNAGTSIDWALKKNFGRNFIDHRNDELMLKGAGFLGPYLQENDDIYALSSHHLTLPLPKLENTKLLHLMMFRHPIERVTSVYNYERKQTSSSTPGAVHARKLTLRDYILWRMEKNVGPTIRNFHVIRSIPLRKNVKMRVTEAEAQMALESIQSIPLLGMVEKFDESMVLFQETLRQYFPSIDLSYKMQNINQDKRTTQKERIAKLHEEIGDEAFQILLDKNKYDLALYESVTQEFQSRQMNILDILSKLQDFRTRCARHK